MYVINLLSWMFKGVNHSDKIMKKKYKKERVLDSGDEHTN